MAEIKFRGEKNREILHKVVPIDTPFSMGVFVGDICNFKCKYCAQSIKDNSKRSAYIIEEFLGMDKFSNIAHQIAEFPQQLKLMLFSSMGEPTLNKNLPDMIKLANELKLSKGYEVVSNASLLTPELSIKLVDAGLTRLVVSIQGVTTKKYKEICGFDINIDKLIANLKFFYEYSRGKCKLHIKTINVCLDDGEDEVFMSMFSQICDTIFIDNLVDACPDIDFSEMIKEESTLFGINNEDSQVKCCHRIFHTLFTLPNGDVVPCCDPPYPLILGNINNESLVDIWNGRKRIEFLKFHLQKKYRQHNVCRNCQTLDQLMFIEDKLDDNTDEILERIDKKYVY